MGFITNQFQKRRKGQTAQFKKALLAVMVAAVSAAGGYIGLIFVGNFAPEAEKQINGSESYTGKDLITSLGPLIVVLMFLVGLVITMIVSVLNAVN